MKPSTESKNTKGVIFYNHRFFHHLGFELLGDELHENFNLNAFMCVFSNSSLTDRSGTLNQGFRTSVIDPFPDFTAKSSASPTFEELCDRRALEIAARARKEQRPIHVFWSGGIDSTTALVALLKNIDAADLKQYVTVYMNQESIDEYPAFYDTVVKPRLNVRDIDELFGFLDGNPIIVTGELGDQLFGSVIMADLLSLQADPSKIDLLEQPYTSVMPMFIRYRLRNDDEALSKKLLDYLGPLIERCPWPIKRTFDCLWWLNFTLKWQHVDQRFAVGFHVDTPDIRQSYELCAHFFKTEAFQRWSVSNPHLKVKDTWASYKFTEKEYIYQYTKDRDYLVNKHKVPSISLRKIKKLRHCFMLDDFKMIGAKDTIDTKTFRRIYGDSFDWLFERVQSQPVVASRGRA